jgi:hypothetical protein
VNLSQGTDLIGAEMNHGAVVTLAGQAATIKDTRWALLKTRAR